MTNPQTIDTPRAYTAEEARKMVLDHMRALAFFWSNVKDTEHHATEKDRLEGLCFSILNIFDGSTDLPAMDIVLRPHPDDKQFHIDEGENYFENGMAINDNACMHEEWHR